jgi:hypothetical protein
MSSSDSYDSNASGDNDVSRPLKSPLSEVHRERVAIGKDPRKALPYKISLRAFLFWQMSSPCYNMAFAKRQLECTCMETVRGYLEDEDIDACIDSCIEFAMLSWEQQMGLLAQWHKYGAVIMTKAHSKRCYILPGTKQLICKHALTRLLAFGYNKWKNIVKAGKQTLLPSHGLRKKKLGNKVNLGMQEVLYQFFLGLQELAAPRATLVVRDYVRDEDFVATQLRYDDADVLELPPSFTKRALFHRLLHERGWTYKYDSRGRILERTCTDGKEQDVPSWGGFRNYWKARFPKLRIARPRKDICGECWTFANKHKYATLMKKNNSKKKKSKDNDDTDDDCSEPTSSEEEVESSDNSDDDEEMEHLLQNEELVIAASKHVESAQKQRHLYQRKKAEAMATLTSPTEDRVLTFVADYAQNMYIPNYAGEQPGETYYYSPLNVYVFGIVDCCVSPHKLHAMIYTEDQGKKGGNNVVSLLWHHLFLHNYANTPTPFKELNYIFDNCGGQNKNRMVFRYLNLIVKKKIATVARAIFLIRGHTKNDCDRLFNTMKKSYRMSNTYTPQDLFDAVKHECVEPHFVPAGTFRNFDEYFDDYMTKLPSGLTNINHCFEVDANRDNGNSMFLRTCDGEPETQAPATVKPEYIDSNAEFWQQLPEPPTIAPPGLQDIKWRELYDKWGKIIPEEKKLQFKYYHEDPGPERRKQVSQHSKASKMQRAERSRTGNSTATTTAAAKKPRKKRLKKTPADAPADEELKESNDGNNKPNSTADPTTGTI